MQKYLPFIATSKHTDDLVPTKTETIYIKEKKKRKKSVGCHCPRLPETCHFLSASAVVAVSNGGKDSIIPSTDSFPTMSCLSVPWCLVHCIRRGKTVSSCRQMLLPEFPPLLHETWSHSLFLRTEDWGQKTALICSACFLVRVQGALCSVSHKTCIFHASETSDFYYILPSWHALSLYSHFLCRKANSVITTMPMSCGLLQMQFIPN